MSTCNTCIDDAITQQSHVELCSQGVTSRIMQLSKWTQQRKNKHQNQKKMHNTHLLQYFVYFVLQLEKNTQDHIFYCTHTREKRPTTNLHKTPQPNSSAPTKKLQVKVVFLPSGKVATMKRGVGSRWGRKTVKTHPKWWW